MRVTGSVKNPILVRAVIPRCLLLIINNSCRSLNWWITVYWTPCSSNLFQLRLITFDKLHTTIFHIYIAIISQILSSHYCVNHPTQNKPDHTWAVPHGIRIRYSYFTLYIATPWKLYLTISLWTLEATITIHLVTC